jgi:hypothetical protein
MPTVRGSVPTIAGYTLGQRFECRRLGPPADAHPVSFPSNELMRPSRRLIRGPRPFRQRWKLSQKLDVEMGWCRWVIARTWVHRDRERRTVVRDLSKRSRF